MTIVIISHCDSNVNTMYYLRPDFHTGRSIQVQDRLDQPVCISGQPFGETATLLCAARNLVDSKKLAI